jgi:hypothetical protein
MPNRMMNGIGSPMAIGTSAPLACDRNATLLENLVAIDIKAIAATI